MRVVDSKGELHGVVFEVYYNLCLVKIQKMPIEPLLLENGEKLNLWKPQYIA
jgi:hypothetical protein